MRKRVSANTSEDSPVRQDSVSGKYIPSLSKILYVGNRRMRAATTALLIMTAAILLILLWPTGAPSFDINRFSQQDVGDGSLSDIADSLDIAAQDGSFVPETAASNDGVFLGFADFTADIRVVSGDNGLTVLWNTAPQAEGFLCYKIVASLSNSSPVFPADGYALEINELDTTTAFLETGCPYSGGDVGGVLDGGQYFYISVTYVYEHASFKSNAVKIMMPAVAINAPSGQSENPEAADDSFNPKLTATALDGKLNFSWTQLDSASVSYKGTLYEGFKHYKVSASSSDPSPNYPENGYIHSAYRGTSSWTLDLSEDAYYQHPKLESGKKYYFSITYVFTNGNFASNTVSLTIPEYTEETGSGFISPQLSVEVSGKTLYFNWTPLSSDSVSFEGTLYSGFKFYKIVASETDSTPIYPDEGYVYTATNLSTSSWSLSPERGNYNKSPLLESGKTYHFTVTYVFDNGKLVTNTATAAVPEYTEIVPEMNSPKLNITIDGSAVNFAWTPLHSRSVKYGGTTYMGFQNYMVSASETDSTPSYPENGYLYSSGLGGNAWTFTPGSSETGASPLLEPGKTYYFSITYVFSNGSFVSDTATATIPAVTTDAEPSPTDFSPALSVTSDGSTLYFSWTALPANDVRCAGTDYTGFAQYSVVASQTNPNPTYPGDGCLYHTEDIGASGWMTDTAGTDSSLSPALVRGQTYYFSVNYIFGSGVIVSNTVQYTVP
jgi:hypothetical protein